MKYWAIFFLAVSVPLFGAGKRDTWIEPLDMTRIQDGVYRGEAKNWPVAAQVEVRIEKRRISRITIIRHQEGKGESAEAITDAVIAEQSLDVDAVSGATLSSKTILQAIAEALKRSIAGTG
ncbi:MAG: FMN-binding protein [Spirochaetaceae bacterium]|jgi:uncharacterized protein with FMN-binding domain|nr:FMN-binding protein [Spirochaetaceae bacterium]